MTERKNQRQTAFAKLKHSMHAQYELDYDGGNSRALIVVFSPNPRAALRRYPFGHDCLFIADRKLQYFTHNPGRQTMLLHGFIDRCGYEKVAFVGSSKGGTGALLWSSLLVRWPRSFNVYCLAFSPQTLLYPFNDNLTSLPSYVNNMRSIETDASAKANFKAYGDISMLMSKHAAPTLVSYGAQNDMDRREALRLSANAHVAFNPIELSFHGSISPFVIDLGNPQAIGKLATKLYADALKDIDLRAILPANREDFANSLRNLRCLPLSVQIDQFCNIYTDLPEKK